MFITCRLLFSIFFFFNDTATTEIYTLSLHDALPISQEELVTSFSHLRYRDPRLPHEPRDMKVRNGRGIANGRSEEHTSELQSLAYLVCRLLLEKKNHGFSRHAMLASLYNFTDFSLPV